MPARAGLTAGALLLDGSHEAIEQLRVVTMAIADTCPLCAIAARCVLPVGDIHAIQFTSVPGRTSCWPTV